MTKFNYLIPTILLIALYLLVAVFIVVGRSIYFTNEKNSYSFRNHFPYELYYQKNIQIVSYFRLFLLMLFALTVGIPIFYATSFKEMMNVAYAITIAIFYVFGAIIDLVLFFIKPNFLKQFKLFSTLAIVVMIMANGMLGIISLTGIYTHFAYKIIAGLAFLLVAFNLLMALNPKLKQWDRLQENKNDNGTLSYVRPKISPLAYTQWLNFLTLILGESLLLISIILVSLGY